MFKRFFVITSVLTLTNTIFLSGQERTLVGRVTDAVTGQPVADGVISIQGEGNRDALRSVLHLTEGTFTASVRADGYRTQDVEIATGQTTLFVALQPGALTLAGVVATTGPGGLRNTPTSTANVLGALLGTAPKNNVLGGLQGKIAGADVQLNSGVPGGDFQLTLRGVKTILGSSSPLFIVDGTYVSNVSIPTGATGVTGGQEALPTRIADINPDDIESIQVLKGAAAATMYGSRGSNGVVIITTKRGGRC